MKYYIRFLITMVILVTFILIMLMIKNISFIKGRCVEACLPEKTIKIINKECICTIKRIKLIQLNFYAN